MISFVWDYLFKHRDITTIEFRILAEMLWMQEYNKRVNRSGKIYYWGYEELRQATNQAPTNFAEILDKMVDRGLIEKTKPISDLDASTMGTVQIWLSRVSLDSIFSQSDDWADTFDEFWDAYPSKQNKQMAIQSYKKALKARIPHQVIMDALPAYKEYLRKTGIAPAYATTWLNQRRWLDPNITPTEEKEQAAPDKEHWTTLNIRKLGTTETDEAWRRVSDELKDQLNPYSLEESTGIMKYNYHYSDIGLARIEDGTAVLTSSKKTPNLSTTLIQRQHSDLVVKSFRIRGYKVNRIIIIDDEV